MDWTYFGCSKSAYRHQMRLDYGIVDNNNNDLICALYLQPLQQLIVIVWRDAHLVQHISFHFVVVVSLSVTSPIHVSGLCWRFGQYLQNITNLCPVSIILRACPWYIGLHYTYKVFAIAMLNR